MSRFITVVLEVSDEATNEHVHEELCTYLHEQSMHSDYYIDVQFPTGRLTKIERNGNDHTIEPNDPGAVMLVKQWDRERGQSDSDMYELQCDSGAVPNVDLQVDTGDITIYSEERDGKLFQVTLSPQLVQHIRTLVDGADE